MWTPSYFDKYGITSLILRPTKLDDDNGIALSLLELDDYTVLNVFEVSVN